MDLTLALHLVAGLGALGMGGGILLREPSRERNRVFALLCGAIALWNLGYVGGGYAGWTDAWRGLFLAGSCATAPLGLRFALVLAGMRRGVRRWLLAPAWLLVGVLWLSSWFDLAGLWHLLAIAILGGILAIALSVVGRYAVSLPRSPERRALQLVFWGAVVAVAGGVSDFVPRSTTALTHLGPVSILVFLLIVCAVIVRHRFLDVDLFLIRVVALIAGATAVGLLFFVVVHYVDTRASFVALFLTSLLVLICAVPLGHVLLARARSLLTLADPVARGLLEISGRLSRAKTVDEFWAVIDEGRGLLPGEVRLDLYLRGTGQERFHLTRRFGTRNVEVESAALAATDALPDLLSRERSPLTRRYLEREAREARGEQRRLVGQALAWLRSAEVELVAPLLRGDDLVGWIGAAGLSADDLTAEVAMAFQAVGNQAAANLERIEAQETARRREALAAVGELAAGLAHEVRNPVAAIRGAGQALGPEATPEQSREMLEVIQEETGRLGRVVGEFLDFARPTQPRREAVALDELARRCLRSSELAGRRLEARVQVTEGAPAASADPDLLQRAFDNLIRNAWEATGEGGVLEIEIHPERGDRVAVRFQDNGPGIPQEQLRQLFHPFHTTRTGGTGLGLALVHRIVEDHGGEIRVEGRPGLGAAFTLVLPGVES